MAYHLFIQQFGWCGAFLLSAFLGVLMLFIWWLGYSEPAQTKALSAKESMYITETQQTIDGAEQENRLS